MAEKANIELLKEFDSNIKIFNDRGIYISDDHVRDIKIEFVYQSNKLEGNTLTLLETQSILNDGKAVGGKDITYYLEAQGHYRAMEKMMVFANKNEPLTPSFLKLLNKELISPLWQHEASYINAKNKGQQAGEFKIVQNKIKYLYGGKTGEITPLSTTKNVKDNMKRILAKAQDDSEHILTRAAGVAFSIFIHQPFVDGNKRTARLISSFLLLRAGCPLFNFRNTPKENYNEYLLQAFFNKDISTLEKFIASDANRSMYNYINDDRRTKLGIDAGIDI